MMNQFSTSADKKQKVQKEKSNASSPKYFYQFAFPSFNRNILKKTGILISQLGFLIIMLKVFNLMAVHSTSQLNQAHRVVENEYLYSNIFNIGFFILLIGAIVYLLGVQKVNFPLLNKEKGFMVKNSMT
ncbi:hypothetical protein [Rhodonellum sp.]|uniref:hypothetical protein n=1 Tax=Rhodonellum sp. TaxID=2231180 RepID=UPI00271BFFD6|nr:hypothetical protein [Rhodonellum sp.]MDO9554798.1 hypothetical protein [Rhodonellum sp.]